MAQNGTGSVNARSSQTTEARNRRGQDGRIRRRMSAPLESYGLIGDCQTAALVGLDGSIDWLCWPRFDSDACFAALLGNAANGRWLITTSDEAVEVSRCYRPRHAGPGNDFQDRDRQARP